MSGFLPRCFVCYPGLFAYFQPEGGKPSRIRGGLMCLTFSEGALIVAAIVTGAFLMVAAQIQSLLSHAQTVVNYAGFAVLSLIGASYLLGRRFLLHIPRLSMPGGLVGSRGYRSAYLHGVFIGGPGQAHCTVSIVIPLAFLFFTSLTPAAV